MDGEGWGGSSLESAQVRTPHVSLRESRSGSMAGRGISPTTILQHPATLRPSSQASTAPSNIITSVSRATALTRHIRHLTLICRPHRARHCHYSSSSSSKIRSYRRWSCRWGCSARSCRSTESGSCFAGKEAAEASRGDDQGGDLGDGSAGYSSGVARRYRTEIEPYQSVPNFAWTPAGCHTPTTRPFSTVIPSRRTMSPTSPYSAYNDAAPLAWPQAAPAAAAAGATPGSQSYPSSSGQRSEGGYINAVGAYGSPDWSTHTTVAPYWLHSNPLVPRLSHRPGQCPQLPGQDQRHLRRSRAAPGQADSATAPSMMSPTSPGSGGSHHTARSRRGHDIVRHTDGGRLHLPQTTRRGAEVIICSFSANGNAIL